MKNKIGLVLEGGGARGAYHLGAYKALREIGYRFNGIAGTSIGAINGALIVQGDWKKAYELWSNSSNSLLYGIDETAFSNIENVTNVIIDIIKSKGIQTYNMKHLFFSLINEKRLRKAKMDLGIVTFNLDKFKSVELFVDQIPAGEIANYFMASANFPLFQREENSSGRFVDGGVVNNLPLNMLPSRGYRELIAIRTYAIGRTQHYDNPSVKITTIKPSKKLGSLLDFNKERAIENLNLGYFDTYKQIKGYLGNEFCIKPLTEDLSYITKMLHMADEKILRAAKVMGHKNINPKRFMFEILLPQIGDYLNLSTNTSYEALIIGFFEEIAKILPMERNKIYRADDFIYEVRKLFSAVHGPLKKYSELPKIVHTSSFLSSFVKNEFFLFVMDIFFE